VALAARPVKVTSADPAEAPQHSTEIVTIYGSGFEVGAVTDINFLLPCDKEPCTETGKVNTIDWEVHSSKKIVAIIEIEELAVIEFRDIEVKMTGRRGGKGTTLFKVISSDSAVPNNDGKGLSMVCALNEIADTLATLRNDEDIDPESGLGSWIYTGGMEKVLCGSGDVVSGRFAGLRLRTDGPGGSPIRFLDLDFDPACSMDLADPDYCIPAEDDLLDRLPVDFLEPSLDTVQLDVRPYNDVNPPHNHIHLMASGLYAMRMGIEPKGLGERYFIRMSSRKDLPVGAIQSRTCAYSAANATGDITVYIWRDGVFSGVPDGLPDGYTVTTGFIDIDDPTKLESLGVPPTVTPGFAQGVLCSNIDLNGDACPGRGKTKNDLCHTLGKVPMRFTMHMEYQ